MKTMKFTPELAENILAGKKTTSWRLFDDKDFQVGDKIELIIKPTLKKIGEAVITNIVTKPLKEVSADDYSGHEKYASIDDMMKEFKTFYGDRVTPKTEVKIIQFKLL